MNRAAVEVECVGLTELGQELLSNWRKWALDGEDEILGKLGYPKVVASCHFYVPNKNAEVEETDPPPPIIPINDAAALAVENILTGKTGNLPEHLSTAVRYVYVGRPRLIGIPSRVLGDWVDHARREIATLYLAQLSTT